MKRNIFLVVLMIVSAVACVSCKHPDLISGPPWGGSIYIFQFQDESFLNKILVHHPQSLYPNDYYSYGEKFAIPLYPKISPNTPIFGETTTTQCTNYIIGENYTIEELLSAEQRYISLNDGYYMCYPFACIENGAQFIDVEWKDFYAVNPDTAYIYDAVSPYKNRFSLKEEDLVHLTGKSTVHFHSCTKKQMTIEDVVDAINTLIDKRELKKYGTAVHSEGKL